MQARSAAASPGTPRRGRSTVANVLFLLAGALAALMALTAGLATDAANGAERGGAVFGAFLVVFGVPALARAADVHLLRRRRRLPFWTPWILVIAFAISLAARLGAMDRQSPVAPDVVGLPVTTAWQRLEESGVRMSGVRPTDPRLYVCSQSPGPMVQLGVGGPECASGASS